MVEIFVFISFLVKRVKGVSTLEECKPLGM